MRRRAGVAMPRSRPIALATLAALGLGALGLASSAALAGHASPLQVTTGETATTSASTPTTTSTTTTPAPDRRPPPPPKPDPKPKKPARAKQPPPPPPPAPQPTAPQPAAPQSPAPAAAVSPSPPPPPPPAASVAVPRPKSAARSAVRKPARTRQRSIPRVRRAQPSRPPAKAARRERAPADIEAAQTFSPTAAPTPGLSEPDSPAPDWLFYFVMLFVLGGLLLIGVSVVPPARVPWPVVARPLYEHRSNLAAIGIGTIAIVLICLNIAVL
jgi:hypothetical protein